MKGFIEVTEKEDNAKVLLPIEIIRAICEEKDGTAFICTFYDGENESGIFCVESYRKVVVDLMCALSS